MHSHISALRTGRHVWYCRELEVGRNGRASIRVSRRDTERDQRNESRGACWLDSVEYSPVVMKSTDYTRF
ncbi:hypothetical protein V2G26_020110 [Clonostachys chloroleuca]